MKQEISLKKKYPVIIYPFEDSHVVWFKKSRSFLLLEKPAFSILTLLTAGEEISQIKKVWRQQFKKHKSVADAFVDEIIQIINQFNNPEFHNRVSRKNQVSSSLVPENFSIRKTYRIQKQVIIIEYQDEWLYNLIHPAFHHLEIPAQTAARHHIQCFSSGNLLVVALNGKIKEAFKDSESEYYKGSIFQLFYSIIYKKPFSGWMCTLHASGIYNNNRALLFTAAAGNGKSTIAAIMKATGTGYLSDDFIAASSNGNVYPFPASISVKEGSVPVLSDYYPELRHKIQEKTPTGKLVRYLPVNNQDYFRNGIKTAGIVFVKYQSGSGFSLVETGKKEALQHFLKETWVNPKARYVQAFFEWIDNTPFYKITYSDNERMIQAVEALFHR